MRIKKHTTVQKRQENLHIPKQEEQFLSAADVIIQNCNRWLAPQTHTDEMFRSIYLWVYSDRLKKRVRHIAYSSLQLPVKINDVQQKYELASAFSTQIFFSLLPDRLRCFSWMTLRVFNSLRWPVVFVILCTISWKLKWEVNELIKCF